MTFFNRISAIRLWIHIQWIRICRWLSNLNNSAILPRPSSRKYHKAVLIGDGLAMGVGDRFDFGLGGGLAMRLKSAISKPNRKKCKTTWDFFDAGEVRSTSADWLPATEGMSKTLYDKLLASSRLWDAEAVVIMIGTQDVIQDKVGMPPSVLDAPLKSHKEFYSEEELCATAKRIRNLMHLLLSSNPHRSILLCDVMTDIPGAALESKHHLIDILNKQIRDFCNTKNPNYASFGFPTNRTPEWGYCSPPRVVGKGKEVMHFDGVHLSPKGYKMFADFLADQVQTIMLKVEWSHWKEVGAQKK